MFTRRQLKRYLRKQAKVCPLEFQSGQAGREAQYWAQFDEVRYYREAGAYEAARDCLKLCYGIRYFEQELTNH